MPAAKRKNAASAAAGAHAHNLEMEGDRLKIYSLQTLLTNKKSPETRALAKLGDVLLPWYEKTVEKPAQKMGDVSDFWQSLAPPKWRDKCRLLGLHRGVLTIALDSAAMRAELDACLRGGLLRELQSRSKGAVYRVKTCVRN